MPARVPVTAVLVAHDGSRWLPDALTALAAQTVIPACVVAVDTGSLDDSAELLRTAGGAVLELPRTTPYAAAVAAAVAGAPAGTRWLWLLHDDCAPEPTALATLLRAAAADPSAALLGPKAVDWDDPRVLVEIGCTTDASGVRDTALEPGELDQGQRDGVREVLAVGTAGALVRRDVWDALGGLDPALPLRDDVDLGWRVNGAGHRVLAVPAAGLRHARALTTGRRELAGASVTRTDRRSAVLLPLAHAVGWRLAPLLPRLLLAAVLRALLQLVLRRPRGAWDELAAPLQVLAHPSQLRAARRARTATRVVGPRALRPLMSSPVARARLRIAALVDRGSGRAVPALDEPEPPSTGFAERLRQRPGLLVTIAVAVVTLLAVRSLLGRGVLVGGSLLAAPDSARELWSAYARSAEPSLALLAAVATVLLGQAGLALDLLLLGSAPLAAAVAYAVAARVTSAWLLRVWAAATWALLPVATGAVSSGRWPAAVLHALLPALLLLGARVLRGAGSGWSGAWRLGLALTVAVALAPVLWPVAALLLTLAGLGAWAAAPPHARNEARRCAAAAALAAVIPVALLLPWSPQLLSRESLLHGPGRLGPGLAEPDLPAWQLLLLHPGGPGTPVVVAAAGLLLAALAALLRRRRAPVAAAGWGFALVGLAAALVVARATADGEPAWPGAPLDVAAAGMLLAAVVGAEGVRRRLTRSAFGWRQLAAVLVVAAAAAAPLVCAADWIRRGADQPLQRAPRSVLPAFASAELAAQPGQRALLLDARPDGTVGYAVTGPNGPTLGDRPARLDDVVAALLTPSGSQAAAAAGVRGIRFVTTRDPELAALLDAQPGMDRQPTRAPLVWRVAAPVVPSRTPQAETRLLPLGAQGVALVVALVLAAPSPPPRRGLVREVRR